MNNSALKRKMLFVTSMPMSRSNAIGIQTLHLAEPFAGRWNHCYWDRGMGTSGVHNSYRLSSPIPYLWPFDTGRGFLTGMVERFGLDWWRGNRLLEYRKRDLRKIFAGTGFAYVAPLRGSEATKCREILETLEGPFVVHIWDLIDSDLNKDYVWLLSKAEHVFCLSATMVDVVRQCGARQVSLLAFVRPESKYCAKPIEGDRLVIGLVGFLSPYREGLHLLRMAIADLRSHFSDARVRYVGPPDQLQFIPEGLKSNTEYVGFMGDEARDKALATCHVSYLPGPMLSPQQDARSRHSIPSRSADYMAVGLPIIAAVHPLSATSAFFSPIRGTGFFPVNTPRDLSYAVQQLRNEGRWKNAAEECSRFFKIHCDKGQAQNRLRSIVMRFI